MALVTDYTIARQEYFETEGYKKAIEWMVAYGVPLKVAENILINAFAAGWNKRKEINRP